MHKAVSMEIAHGCSKLLRYPKVVAKRILAIHCCRTMIQGTTETTQIP
jgi:hypothetical protein